MCATLKCLAARVAYVPFPTPGGPKNTHCTRLLLLADTELKLLEFPTPGLLDDEAAAASSFPSQPKAALLPQAAKKCEAPCLSMFDADIGEERLGSLSRTQTQHTHTHTPHTTAAATQDSLHSLQHPSS